MATVVNGNIKCVAFDVGGVLVDDGFLAFYQKLAARFPIGYDHFDEIFIRCQPAMQLRVNATTLQSYWDHAEECVQRAYGVSLYETFGGIDILNNMLFQGFVLKPYAYSLLDRLAQEGYLLITISNDFHEKKNFLKTKYRYYDLIAHNFISCEHGYAKPDERFFYHVLGSLDINPREILFIDDRLGNLEVASAIGFNVLHASRHHEQPLAQRVLEYLGLEQTVDNFNVGTVKQAV